MELKDPSRTERLRKPSRTVLAGSTHRQLHRQHIRQDHYHRRERQHGKSLCTRHQYCQGLRKEICNKIAKDCKYSVDSVIRTNKQNPCTP